MSGVTVKKLADELGMTAAKLLDQLAHAGVVVRGVDPVISDADKMKLLQYVKELNAKQKQAQEKAQEPKKLTLKHKETSTLRLSPGRGGGSKTIQVEVKKKRTVVVPALETLLAEKAKQHAAASAVPEETPKVVTAAASAAVEASTGASSVPNVSNTMAATTTASAEMANVAVAAAPEATPVPVVEADPLKRQAQAIRSRAAENAARAVENAVRVAAEKAAAAERAANAPKVVPVKPAEKDKTDRSRPPRPGAGGKTTTGTGTAPAVLPSTTPESQARPKPTSATPSSAPSNAARKKGGKGFEKRRDQEGDINQLNDRNKRRKKGGKDSGFSSTTRYTNTNNQHGFEKPLEPMKREVAIGETIVVNELASRLAIKTTDLIKALMKMGVMAGINQKIDQDTAMLIVEELGHTAVVEKDNNVETDLLQSVQIENQEAERVSRPPVVTIMGHVDHGKTSLLDYIRKTRVVAGEAGGITQHIGAYHVDTPRGVVTFLDTPGHAAFTRMRARGAKVTDIVVLVIASDDGVMPQTIEAIQHAKAAKVPMVVAVTKMDKPSADIERVKQELTQYEIVAEDWGGETQFVGVSAHTGLGIEQLLEAILNEAEILELSAPIDGSVQGVVLETRMEKGRGSVATVLIKSGTLRQGDMLLAGGYFGRVRAMFDENDCPVKEATPSIPVSVLGLSGTPDAGDDALVVADERKAREIAAMRGIRTRDSRLASQQSARGDMFARMGTEESKQLAVLVKADVHGSAEALSDVIRKLSTDEVNIRLLGASVGGITESDVELASASGAIIIGFNTRPDAVARRRIQETGVNVLYHSIIYKVMDDIQDAASGLLGTELHEKMVGLAEVRDVFSSSKLGAIAGCLVVEGRVQKDLPIRVLRNQIVIFEGALESLRRHKDEVPRVEAGTECGIGVKDYNDVRKGDMIEVFERFEVKRRIKVDM